MIIAWPNWRIESYEHGYRLLKLVGEDRWVAQSWHATAAQACKELLDYRIRTETTDFTINAIDEASARLRSAELIRKLDEITNEVLKGLNS